MNSIAIFNNKGGVGKTTFLCNFAAYLKIKQNKRVIVIDADPQCNATIYVTNDCELEEFYSKSKTKTIFDIIKPLQRGNDYIAEQNIPIITNREFGFDVILGDTRLSLVEDFLSTDWISGKNGEPRGLKTTFIFQDLLQKLSDRYDYVFFDIGPSLGAINRCVLLACEYFIMPMSSDIFSLKAVDNIAESLSNWKANIDKGLADFQQNNEGEPYVVRSAVASANLHFLGYIYQQYNTKSKDGVKRPVKAYDNIIKKMNDLVSSKLGKFCNPRLADSQLLIGEIPTLNSLIPLSQIAHKPIFSLSSGDGVVGAHFSKVREYEEVVKGILEKMNANLNVYEMA